MHPDRVQHVVARYLVQADVLDDAHGAAGAALLGPVERERLAFMRGLITKIRHNALRSVIPGTLRLLSLLGKELEFFRDYAPVYLAARQAGPLSTERQLELLELELGARFADRRALADLGLRDMLAHEATLWRLRTGMIAAPEGAAAPGAVRWRGSLKMNPYQTDVLVNCAALTDRTFRLGRDLTRRRHVLAYWKAGDGDEVETFEIDDLTRLVFSLVDSERDLAAIAAALSRLGLGAFAASDIQDLLAEAVDIGLLEY